ncbi:MAG: type I 3-dehydroquinate dehydratase [Akkermansiaceae bacterium]|jgi:3-dehydroquinate dehydratase I|nr:type I 3-dehydroquinate dehydratase [Akkermansiaceae bacterium]
MKHRGRITQHLSDRKRLVVGAIADSSTLSTTPTDCDVVELRLDSLGTGENVHQFAKECPLPVLITARGPEEGGESSWSTEERAHAYRAFLPHAAIIDIELCDFEALSSVIDDAKEIGIQVIGSLHDFEVTPEPASLAEKINTRADLHKFAFMAQSSDDIKKHLEIFERLSGRALSVMGMGPLGAAARPLMAEAGSLLNYGFLGATPTAPNQWPAGLLKATLAI